MGERVKFEAGDTFSTITIDDGRVNAMSIEMLAEINAALDQAEAARKILLIAGKERLFSAGFDLKTFQAGKEPLFRMLKAGAETAERILGFPYPVVIACTGHAVAMGVFLVLAGDERIGCEGKFKIHANEVEIGLTLPRFAIEMTRQRVTPAAFSRATILAEPYSHEEGLAAGFLDRVVPEGEVLETAKKKAASLARLNMGAHTATKARVREDALKRLRAAIEADIEEWTGTFLA